MAKKEFDKAKAKVWGSPDYLVFRYANVDSARELSRNSKATKEAKEAVAAIRTDRDNIQVYKAYETSVGKDGKKSWVVHVSVGLNGNGNQADYFEALRKLVATDKFRIFDAYVDYADDLMDVLCSFVPSMAESAKAKDGAKAGACGKKEEARPASKAKEKAKRPVK